MRRISARQGWVGEKSGLFEHPAGCSPFVPEVLPSEMVFPQPANKSEADWLWQQQAHWRMANPHTCWTGIPEHDVDANARLNVQLSPIVDHRLAHEEYLALGKQQGTR
jgi:hypothetical protein